MWYSIEALFKCDVTNEAPGKILYEKSIFLIQAQDEQHAQQKAQLVVRSFENNYENYEGNEVRWKFIRILDIQDICENELYDGVEVFSRLQWDYNEESDSDE